MPFHFVGEYVIAYLTNIMQKSSKSNINRIYLYNMQIDIIV